MKIEFDKKKSAEILSGIVQGTVDMGKKAAANTKSGIAAMVEKSKVDGYERRMKKYNPLFPQQYTSDAFNLPNMVVIVDDAERRDIDVCEGAIGWLDSSTGTEILYLYDEAVEFSGLQFVPTANCDAIYYVDSFDRKRFIKTEYLFSKAHEERIAELKNIAYMLGAKRCSIEISEYASQEQNRKASIGITGKVGTAKTSESSEQSSTFKESKKVSGHVEVEFQGSDTPQRPVLKWFAHDDNIRRLIDMRCENSNSIKMETLELMGASSATMSQKAAYAVDCAVAKIGGKGHISLNAQAAKEHRSCLVYKVEF